MRNPSRQAVAWALALPTLLLLLVFFFYPLLRIAGMSVGFPQLSLADYATVCRRRAQQPLPLQV